MEHTFKLFEFNIYNDKNTELSDGSDDNDDKKKISEYVITETLQVPILGNLLKPILINRGK